MKKKLTVYQKPTSTKCRTTLHLLQERGAEFDAIVVRGNQAVLGRPPENIEKLL